MLSFFFSISSNFGNDDVLILFDKFISFFSNEEVKVVWREEEKTKVGRGKITHDDDNFVYLAGEKGKVIVNKKDIIAIKQWN